MAWPRRVFSWVQLLKDSEATEAMVQGGLTRARLLADLDAVHVVLILQALRTVTLSCILG